MTRSSWLPLSLRGVGTFLPSAPQRRTGSEVVRPAGGMGALWCARYMGRAPAVPSGALSSPLYPPRQLVSPGQPALAGRGWRHLRDAPRRRRSVLRSPGETATVSVCGTIGPAREGSWQACGPGAHYRRGAAAAVTLWLFAEPLLRQRPALTGGGRNKP